MSYGIRGNCLNLLRPYMQDRWQTVSFFYNDSQYYSSPTPIAQGVPQGFILGPMLFLLYVNDLCGGILGTMVCQYADYTFVLLTGPDDRILFTTKTSWVGYSRYSSTSLFCLCALSLCTVSCSRVLHYGPHLF